MTARYFVKGAAVRAQSARSKLNDRQIDGLIAERLFGLVPCERRTGNDGYTVPCYHAPVSGPVRQHKPLRRYTGDWNETRLVIAEVNRRDWTVDIRIECDGLAAVAFWSGDGGDFLPWPVDEPSEAFGRAVCLATLRLLDVFG